MEMKRALKGQYHAALMMLREVVAKCPDEIWEGGTHPRHPWRIAYHALYYTHLYLMPTMEDFRPWEKHRPACRYLWEAEGGTPIEPAYSQAETTEYLDLIADGVDGWVDALDLDAPECGIPWYSMPKLDHQLVSLRHLGIHLGQLQELVMRDGADLEWIGAANRNGEL